MILITIPNQSGDQWIKMIKIKTQKIIQKKTLFLSPKLRRYKLKTLIQIQSQSIIRLMTLVKSQIKQREYLLTTLTKLQSQSII